MGNTTPKGPGDPPPCPKCGGPGRWTRTKELGAWQQKVVRIIGIEAECIADPSHTA